MRPLEFFKRKQKTKKDQIIIDNLETTDRSNWTGEDFEFLITGDIRVSDNDHDKIMTPKTINWEKVTKNDWPYYKVGQDEFSYSWEEPGIQMTFNKEITFEKAKMIADEIIKNILESGQAAELIILDKRKVYKFQ